MINHESIDDGLSEIVVDGLEGDDSALDRCTTISSTVVSKDSSINKFLDGSRS